MLPRSGIRLLLLLLSAGSVGGVVASRATADTGWPWPLELPDRQITGTFMEARQGRFHSGIDLRTQGREGLVVRAPVAGSITRMRASARGYGVAIYLTAADGSTLVFAHLSRLNDRLRAVLVAGQFRAGDYEISLNLRPGSLPVQAGEVLALSGATGVGAPHLHVEVRDGAGHPQDPLDYFDIHDTRPPIVEAVRLVPRDSTARIRGQARTSLLDPEAETPIQGPVGVQVRVSDHAVGNDFSLAPKRVEARLDGSLLFRIVRQSLDFSQTSEMDLQYDRDGPGPPWLRLYALDGLDLPGCDGPRDGQLSLPADSLTHRLEVLVWDQAGNQSQASFALRAAAPDFVKAAPAPKEDSSLWDASLAAEEAGVLVDAFGSGELPPADLLLQAEPAGDGEARILGPWTPSGTGSWQCLVPWASLPSSTWILRDGRGRNLSPPQRVLTGGAPLRLDGDLVLRILDPTRFVGGGLWVHRVRTPRRPAEAGAWREIEGPVWSLNPSAFHHPDGLDLTWSAAGDSADTAHVGWVLVDEDGEVQWLGSVQESRAEGGLRPVSPDPGELRRLEDVLAPGLRPEGLRLSQRTREEREVAPGLSLARWPSFGVALEETGSGIEASGLQAWVDGTPWPVRLDPEANRAWLDFDRDPGPGTHRVRMQATDRSGRHSEEEWRLQLAP